MAIIKTHYELFLSNKRSIGSVAETNGEQQCRYQHRLSFPRGRKLRLTFNAVARASRVINRSKARGD